MQHSDDFDPSGSESFEDLKLRPPLQRVLDLWGYNRPSPIQVASPAVLRWGWTGVSWFLW